MKYYLPGFIIALALIIQDSNGEPPACEEHAPQSSAPTDTVKPMPPAFLAQRPTTTITVEQYSERQNGRARQLAVLLRNFTQEEIEHGVLTIFQPYPTVLQTLPVKASLGYHNNYSALIPTGRHLCEIEWAHLEVGKIRSTYFVAQLAVRGKVVAAGSMTQHLTWMGANIKKIATLRLIDLALPGTIDSAMFSPYGSQNLANYTDLDRTFSQEEDIFTQLVYGIRAFQIELKVIRIKPGYYGFRIKGRQDNGREFEKVHGIYP